MDEDSRDSLVNGSHADDEEMPMETRSGEMMEVDTLDDCHCHVQEWTQRISRVRLDDLGRTQAGFTPLRNVVTSWCWPDRWEQMPLEVIRTGTAHIWSTVGVHPNWIGQNQFFSTDMLESWAERPECIGVGEVGLDYDKTGDMGGQEAQRKFLADAARVAHRLSKPLVLHLRDARSGVRKVHGHALDILQSSLNSGHQIYLHCFMGTGELVEKWKSSVFGIGPLIYGRDAAGMRETIMEMNARDILLETDSPFLSALNTFHPWQVQGVCHLRDVQQKVMRQILAQNFRRVFNV